MGAKDLSDPVACARWLLGALRHIDGCARDGVRAVAVGSAHVAIDEHRDTPFPSVNPNHATIVVDGGAVDGAVIDGIVAAYRSAGVKRFFVWLVPAERETDVSPLLERGLEPFNGPDYLTLVRPAAGAVAARTDLAVRRLEAEEVRRIAGAIGDAVEQPRLPLFLNRTAGMPEFVHWAAFDGERVVAAASSLLWDGAAYLGWAATAPAARGRGAQSALIAARVAHAHASGCGWCVSEIVSIGKTSLGNLKRAGFTVGHTARVFQSGS